jgi:hypothetical protein
VGDESSCSFPMVSAETVAIFKSIETALKFCLPERNSSRQPTLSWHIARLTVS